ncbi:MAG: amidohydrolase [Thaumarchaeota archaeon]|nr:amidohydrolase [Nitrososphaerota archaeon]
MIIDCHVHLSVAVDPVWRKASVPFNAERLLKWMNRKYIVGGKPVKVDVCVIQPAIGSTIYEPGGKAAYIRQSQHIVDAVRKYPKKLIGCMTLNPRMGVKEGVQVLRTLVKKEGFKAVKIHPNMHLFRPDLSPDFMNPIVEASIDLNIPLFIHTGDPPYSLPVQLVPSIEEYPHAKFVFFHFGIQYSGFPYEAMYVAKKNDNVYLEISWAPLPRIREAVKSLGADRLIYGTDSPAMEQGSQLSQIDALCEEPPIGIKMSSKDRDKILGGNIARLMNLDLSRYS